MKFVTNAPEYYLNIVERVMSACDQRFSYGQINHGKYYFSLENRKQESTAKQYMLYHLVPYEHIESLPDFSLSDRAKFIECMREPAQKVSVDELKTRHYSIWPSPSKEPKNSIEQYSESFSGKNQAFYNPNECDVGMPAAVSVIENELVYLNNKYGNSCKEIRVFDFGCGTGAYVSDILNLAQRYDIAVEIVAWDPVTKALECLNQRVSREHPPLIDKVNILKGSWSEVYDIIKHSKPFHLALSMGSAVQLAENEEQFLEYISTLESLLEPEGRFVLSSSTPNRKFTNQLLQHIYQKEATDQVIKAWPLIRSIIPETFIKNLPSPFLKLLDKAMISQSDSCSDIKTYIHQHGIHPLEYGLLVANTVAQKLAVGHESSLREQAHYITDDTSSPGARYQLNILTDEDLLKLRNLGFELLYKYSQNYGDTFTPRLSPLARCADLMVARSHHTPRHMEQDWVACMRPTRAFETKIISWNEERKTYSDLMSVSIPEQLKYLGYKKSARKLKQTAQAIMHQGPTNDPLIWHRHPQLKDKHDRALHNGLSILTQINKMRFPNKHIINEMSKDLKTYIHNYELINQRYAVKSGGVVLGGSG